MYTINYNVKYFQTVRDVTPVQTSNRNISFFPHFFIYLILNYKTKIQLLNYIKQLYIVHFQMKIIFNTVYPFVKLIIKHAILNMYTKPLFCINF